jgi:hypothetical protein
MTTRRRDQLCGVFGLALAGLAAVPLLSHAVTPVATGRTQAVHLVRVVEPPQDQISLRFFK